jgi:hypothetical protein
VTQFGSAKSDEAFALADDGLGGLFIAGLTRGDLAGPNAGGLDAFVGRYDGGGSQLWLTQLGTNSSDQFESVASDGRGGCLAAGYTAGQLGDASYGLRDAIVGRFDESGQRSWLAQFGTSAAEEVMGVAGDAAGGAFVTGYTAGLLGEKHFGNWDAFVAHLTGAICYPDCDTNGALDLFDFLCFVNQFNAGDPAADCDASGALDLFDFLCFTNAFNAGC